MSQSVFVEEIVRHHIFTALPSKFLIGTCRLVCKEWNDIILNFPLRLMDVKLNERQEGIFLKNCSTGKFDQVVHVNGYLKGIMKGLKSIKSLTSVDMVFNGETENDYEQLAQLKLKELAIHYGHALCSKFIAKHLRKMDLVRLVLTSCSLKQDSMQSIGEMTCLKTLFISSNKIEDEGVAHLSKLKLEKLDLKRNYLSNMAIHHLQEMTTLKYLDLSENVIDECSQFLCNMKELEYLNLKDNAIDGKCFRDMSNLHNLKILILHQNRITSSEALEHLSQVVSLTDLDLSQNRVGVSTTYLSNLKNLKSLDLSSCKITKGGLGGFSKLLNLEVLKLNQNSLGSSDFEELSHLNLRILHIFATGLEKDSAKFIGNIKSLRMLDLSFNNIFDSGLFLLSSLVNLQELHLSSTSITDSGIIHLSQMKTLKILHFNSNSLGNETLKTLSQFEFDNLHLEMCHTKIDKDSIPFISQMKSLASIRMFGTNFSRADVADLRKACPQVQVSER